MALKFRHRIGLLVSLAALALIALAAVTLVLGNLNKAQLTGIETHYVPLIELDRDLEARLDAIPQALEDAASAAEEAKLDEADALAADFLARLDAGARRIADNGGDARALRASFQGYYAIAREVSAALVAGDEPDDLAPRIEAMRAGELRIAAELAAATGPDRARLAAAFARARATQNASLWIDIGVAGVALALMAFLSWRIIRRTVAGLTAVSVGVERLARGEFGQKIDVPAGDELGDLAREANRTADRLREYREQHEREIWIKSGVTEVADRIVGELDPVTLAGNAMRHLAAYVGARAAAVHVVDGNGEMRLLETTEGGAPDAAPADTAATRRASDPDVRVEPGAGGHRIVVPLVHGDRVMAAIELTTSAPPEERTLELMARVRSVIGTAFRVAEARQRESELLRETQRQALAVDIANKELEAFSYSVSHDLRTPLRGIDGFSQALLEDCADKLDATGEDYLRRIRAAAQRMAELIDDLLRLSRVSRTDFRRDRVDLSAIVGGIVADLQRASPERAVEVRLQPDVVGLADPRLIRITLENLLGNAWKFTSKTPAPVVEFGARTEGGEVVYSVRDNGAGFDMKHAERLFGAFQRLHTDREFPGTGIGLATVQRIINRHGGRIWVDAAVDQGATFHFTLPSDPTGTRAP